MGIESLSAWVKLHGHDTELLFDPATFSGQENARIGLLAKIFDKSDEIVDNAAHSGADLIAFSAFTVNYRWALEIAQRIKEKTDIPIIFGGVHASAVPQRVLANPQVDAVVVGEGEAALLELLDGMKDGRLPSKPLPNVWVKSARGEPLGVPPRPYIRELDKLPFPDKDLFYDKVPALSDSYMIMTSRGCPYKCSFCCNSLYHEMYRNERGHVRRYSPERVIGELEWARDKYNPSFISFWDDVFTADIKWLRAFRELYSRIGLPYDVYTHPLALDEERVKILAETGCYRVKLGLQTVSERTRKAYLDRTGSAEQVEMCIGLLKKHGLTVGIDHMFGLPGEGADEQDAAAKFYTRVRPDRINSYWMLYFPGAKIVETALEKGMLTKKDIEDIEEGRGETSYMYLRPGASNEKEIMKAYQTFFDLLPMLPEDYANRLIEKGMHRKLPYHPLIRQVIVATAAILQRDKRYLGTLRNIFSLKRVP